MSNTFTKKGFRGFTLIELLVVIAIIGLLSTIIASPIQNARKKARDAKKIAEVKAVELSLDQYAEANRGSYPLSLAALAPIYMPILPTFAVTGQTATKDEFAYTTYTASGVGITSVVFGYHLGVHLEAYSQALDTDRDCIGSDTGATLPVGICTFYNGASTITAAKTGNGPLSVATGLGTGVTGTDFSGADNATTTCSSVDDCVFDVSSQQ